MNLVAWTMKLENQGKQVKTGQIGKVLDSEILSEIFGVEVYVDLNNSPPVVLAAP